GGAKEKEEAEDRRLDETLLRRRARGTVHASARLRAQERNARALLPRHRELPLELRARREGGARADDRVAPDADGSNFRPREDERPLEAGSGAHAGTGLDDRLAEAHARRELRRLGDPRAPSAGARPVEHAFEVAARGAEVVPDAVGRDRGEQ